MESTPVADELELRLLAATDGLTGSMRRREFLDVAEADVARARRYRSPLSCLVIGIDHFKSINDKGGHAAGELVLQHFVSVYRSTLRAPDYIGRTGAEEFVVMLPETPLLNAFRVAERILENIAASTIDASQHQLTVTTSIGVAEYSNQTGSLDQLLAAAEAALADAKKSGSNQAVCYLDDMQLVSGGALIN
jgi:diguanylate cyclase (GGDEF)-like protein